MFALGKYSETSVKRTPNNFKRTLSRVPKWTSYISLYNKPLFRGHIYLADADTKISRIGLISIVKNLY